MIKHIVAWNYNDRFSDEENIENAKKIKYDLENLVNYISEIVKINVIINPIKTSNRKVVLISVFNTEEDLAKYQNHPEHLKVVKFIGEVMKDRVCLDLEEE